jgi:hypothetical protein
MRQELNSNGHIAAPAMGQANPGVHAPARPPQPPPPAPKRLPTAPETAADPHAAAARPRPAQRGLAWLCELLRTQHEE